MMATRVRLVIALCWLVTVAGVALADAPTDANNGAMGGYRLGEAYPLTASTPKQTASDRSLKIKAEQAKAPADIDTVYLYATPATYTIGKIVYHQDYADLAAAEQAAARYKAQLEAEYPDWERLKAPIPMGKAGGAMVSRLRNGPYALIVFYRGTDEGAELAVELEFESASAERKAFKAQLREESAAQ